MDGRWKPISRDSKRDVKVLLHPTSPIYDVRRGVSALIIDLSIYAKDISQSAFDLNVTLAFNRELFGESQPKPNQVLELQLWQDNVWKPLWLGHIDNISSFTLSRGERQMQLIAKTREQYEVWKSTSRVTPLFPQMTNLTYIAQRIARTCDLKGDEIALPPSAIMTAHSNTQLTDMTAWDMVNSLFVALGWTPFIDVIGRLRAADRSLSNRQADIVLLDHRIVKIGGQRIRPATSRVRVSWLNPVLERWTQQTRMLKAVPVTIGWFLIWHTENVKFSDDGTQRAEKTKFVANPSVEKWGKAKWCKVTWTQQTATGGKLHFDNEANFITYASLLLAWTLAILAGTGTFGFASGLEAAAQAAFCVFLLKMGPGVYEIWGTPYDYVHARNISEAFDESVPEWIANVSDITCDFVVNEEHGRAIAIRELIYQSWSASKWSVVLVDDPRIEYGDLLQFPDGSVLFVEDFTRNVTRGSEATLDVRGFLLGTAKAGPEMPAGTIMIGGYGDAGPFYFLSPDGKTKYAVPPSNPIPGSGLSALARLSTGDVVQVGGNAPNFPNSGAGAWRGSDLTKLSEVADVQIQDGQSVTADALGNWYVLDSNTYGDPPSVVFSRLNAASEVVASWTIPFPPYYSDYRNFPGAETMAVTPDGKTVYCWLSRANTGVNEFSALQSLVHVFSLEETGSYLRQLTTDWQDRAGYQSLLVVPDGSNDVLVAFDAFQSGPTQDDEAVGSIRRYKQDGTLVWEAEIPTGPGPFYWFGLAAGLPGDTHFLAWAYTSDETYSNARYVWFDYATGTPDNTRNFAPEDGEFEFDSQFVVLSQPISLEAGASGGSGGGDGGDGGGGGEGGGGGDPTIPDYSGIVNATLARFNPVVSAADEEAGKAQLCREAAWAIYQQDPNIGLLKKDYGTNVYNMSVDIVVQQSNGDYADMATASDNGDGTVTIKAGWGPNVGDGNTTDKSRWIQPTQALADLPGPMVPR